MGDEGYEDDQYEDEQYQNSDAYEDDGYEAPEQPRAGRERLPNPYAVPEVEELLEEAIEILAEARPLPMSTTVKVNRDELLHLLEQAQEKLPEELRAARWLLKERDDFVAKARQEHQDLIDEGRAQVGRMVERQQIVKAAEHRARQIVSEAKEEANTLKRQVEDYCDQRLASFEQVLNRTAATVQKGRERLLGSAKATTEEILGTGGSHRGGIDGGDIDLSDRRRSQRVSGNSASADYEDDLVDEQL
ncbi:MAG: hypothetical protein ACRBK7_16160 [Acidimicrobiales bacterium]